MAPTLELCVFQEIRILQAKKSNFHEMEQEREEAIHRLQVHKKSLSRNTHTHTLPWQAPCELLLIMIMIRVFQELKQYS